jgi:serine protease Do
MDGSGQQSLNRWKPSPAGAVVLVLIGSVVATAIAAAPATDAVTPRAPEARPQGGDWLGMRIGDAQSLQAREWGLAPDSTGVVVLDLAPGDNGSRARSAGVLPGDVVTAADGNEIRDLAQLNDIAARLDGGSAILIDVVRRGQPPRTLVLGPNAPSPAARPAPAAPPSPPAPAPADNLFLCPQEGLLWPAAAVPADRRCPRCGQPLTQI